ncbi:cyclase family protein [Solihabitans fulvus]|uniref:Cyclase family protein n=1 Tax=Solihabitans fulvus TaxID=1892852 RepID=A0A5B2WQ57_9PSEU|nr:cyclase family protein [Solihabitans fulvus]KAA2252579.1 cyclase family protein [Solihabitans fulvus]
MTPMPPEFHDLAKRVNNWGRWGRDDQRGTLNLLTPHHVRAAAGLVRTGRTVSLSLPLSQDGPQTGIIPGRINPHRTMIMCNTPITGDTRQFCTSDDVVEMGLQAATHWDALAHVSYAGRLYNGFPASVVTSAGAAYCGVDRIGQVVGRGVLLDLPRMLGVDVLPPGYAVTAADLDAAEELARITVSTGDLVLVRTGQLRRLKAGDRDGYGAPSPGPSLGTVEWFHRRDIAAVATDNLTFEVYPGELADAPFAVHLLHLVEMGLLQGQNFDLEELSEDCADDGVYEFLLHATPLPFRHAVGAPVAPVAVK